MFLDVVDLHLSAGRGGDGASTMRRESHVPRGGPDGGDGGRGGSIYVSVDTGQTTLRDFEQKRRLQAGEGGNGGNKKSHGKAGKDLEIGVPPGTAIFDAVSGDLIADIVSREQRVMIVKGGRGGLGNAHFVTSTHQAPRHAQRGEPGETREVRFELRLIADVGLVGLPNAGKSTTLAALTAAQPKIGDYPFTTLEPNLGVIELGLEDGRRPTVADLPGLIEGASMGAGLGFAFLRHASRTRILVHVVDASTADPLRDAAIIREELAAHNPALLEKTTLVVLNKIDRPGVRERLEELRTGFSALGLKSIACSALGGALGEGITDLRNELAELLPDAETLALPTEPAGVVVHRIDPIAVSGFEVSRDGESYRVRGKAIERLVHQTDFARDESAQRFHHELKRQGIESALRKAGCRAGDTVVIGELSLEWEDPDEADLLNTADAAEASDLDLEELGETLEEAAVGSSEGSQ
ncbi:MAG: GTPase ObgE [Chloroflexi bacterium]|nr:MAG: GTPase ObgE [Chloroflexota bacterium]